ncbi:MAG: SDR family oxidoreductase [Saprospiraceae bacterium]|nr:SDR family oxidoreductase [Saprospiraceae bacterium]
MKILITGNLGYVGPGLVREIKHRYPTAEIIGYDVGYFAKYVTSPSIIPEAFADVQYYGDIRNFPAEILTDVDAVVSLAAISNDPIGNQFEEPTMAINYKANLNLAKHAKESGVRRFIFASSCSVYGAAEDTPRTEKSSLNPLTAYAKSKIKSEEELEKLVTPNFQVTCLRFATACGMSERLRLDLVLNDFVAGAVTAKKIDILSDGTPWRPLIHVLDMARAIAWAIQRNDDTGGAFLTINTGSNQWNYQVKDLAYAVNNYLPEVKVFINENAEPDKRSYRVNFDLFEKLAPFQQPQYDLQATVNHLVDGLRSIGFADQDFRNSELMRLNVIKSLLSQQVIDSNLALIT